MGNALRTKNIQEFRQTDASLGRELVRVNVFRLERIWRATK